MKYPKASDSIPTIFEVVLAVAVLIFLSAGIWYIHEEHELTADGILTAATITGHFEAKGSDNNGNERVSYSIGFRYKDFAEHPFTGTIGVPDSVWNRFKDGDKIQIIYSNKNHAVSKFPGSDDHLIVGWSYVIVGVMLLIFLGVIICQRPKPFISEYRI